MATLIEDVYIKAESAENTYEFFGEHLLKFDVHLIISNDFFKLPQLNGKEHERS